MVYRGFRIERDAESSHACHFVILEWVHDGWQPIAYANAEPAAQSLIDQMLLARETLLAPFRQRSHN